MAQTGPPFDLDKLDKLLERLMSAPRYEVLGGYPAGSGHREQGKGSINNATLAAIHDLGAPGAGIDSRPFLRQSVTNRRKEYTTALAADLRVAIQGETSMSRPYELLALRVEAGIKEELTRPSPPFKPLSAKTIARKGSSVPLIDEGQLRSSATAVVRKAGQTK